MNKTDLANYVAEKAEISKKDAAAAVAAVFDGITEALKSGDRVQLVGFGSFEVKERAERNAINPATGETIRLPKKLVPKFSAGKALKEAVDK